MFIRSFSLLLFLALCISSFGQTPADSVVRSRAAKADSLADVHRKRNKLDSSIFYNKRALQLSRKISDYQAATRSLVKLGEIYERQKKEREALDYFRSALISANKSKDIQLRVKTYDRLITAFKKADKYKEAYYFHVSLTQLNDSINKVVAEQRLREHDQLNQNLETSKSETQRQIVALNDRISSLESELTESNRIHTEYKKFSEYIFGGLALAALVILISRIVVKRKLEKERRYHRLIETEQIQIANDIRKDLDSSLSKINLYSQGVYDTPSTANVKKHAGSIYEISSRLLEDIRDVIWNVATVAPTLPELVKEINQYGESFFKDMAIEIVSQSPDKVPGISVNKLTYRAIFVVVKEIFQEIARQSKAMNVFVTFSLQDDHFNITIKDDGLGLQYDPDDKDDWYLKMKSRLQPIGGLLNVTKEELGTRLRLDVKLNISKKDRLKK